MVEKTGGVGLRARKGGCLLLLALLGGCQGCEGTLTAIVWYGSRGGVCDGDRCLTPW